MSEKRGSFLDNDIKFLSGVGDKRAALLSEELGIRTMRDLLYHFPFRYVDRSRIYKINEITDDSLAYIQLRVRIDGYAYQGVGRKKRLTAVVSDGSGSAELVWFSGHTWIEKRLEPGREYIVFGKPGFFGETLSIVHPELEPVASFRDTVKNGVQGIYSTTEKLNNNHLGTKAIYKLVGNLWAKAGENVTETLPSFIMSKFELMGLKEALFNVHFPENEHKLKQARYRLKFEELFGIQLGLVDTLKERKQKYSGFLFPRIGDRFNKFFNEQLPFELTGAQKKVMKEIRSDFAKGTQMNRLLQGDVGSGKTLVALLSMLIAADNGYQSCLMAPTEILATQHYNSIAKMLGNSGVGVELLTGSTPKKKREEITAGLEDKNIDILIGTHALLEDYVQFANLGLVVIDEQHRFGVEQRARLWTKNQTTPHILVMTATPIPRTLAMTLYGDLDVSVIDELPPGRKPIKTIHMRDTQRLRVNGFLREQISNGRQVYVVYPLIFESEKLNYKDLQDGFESLSREFPPPDYFTTVVHGKMKAADKENNMQLFKNGTANIMVATSVIEVGVDVPNATVMVIESAEKFGLSQLHQLRGRVGRGSEQSYCILMTGDKLGSEAKARINAMVQTNDGFELSELDLKLRGAGDISGTQQSGLAFELRISNLAKDSQIVETTRKAALEIPQNMEGLSGGDIFLLEELKNKYINKGTRDFSMIS